MTLIYLDTCAIQRPLDDRIQFRVRVEADAITTLLAYVEQGALRLVDSAVLRAELSRNPHRDRRDFAENLLDQAAPYVRISEAVLQQMSMYERSGLAPFDALHLASAVVGGANYFCSTDDRLLRRARQVNTRSTRIVNPLELAETLSL